MSVHLEDPELSHSARISASQVTTPSHDILRQLLAQVYTMSLPLSSVSRRQVHGRNLGRHYHLRLQYRIGPKALNVSAISLANYTGVCSRRPCHNSALGQPTDSYPISFRTQ